VEVISLAELVLLVRQIDLGFKDVLKICFKKRLVPVNTETLREFVKLVEFDESHVETIKAKLEVILLPFAQLDGQRVLDELEEVEVRELVALRPELVSQLFHEMRLGFES
jgi:hypothetical protein